MTISDISLRGDLPPIDAQHAEWIARAESAIDEAFLLDVLTRMVEIPSPTGAERPLAEMLVASMRARDRCPLSADRR